MHPLYKISFNPLPGLRVKSFSVLFLVSLFSVQNLHAQISDDFSDGDFITNPPWYGSTAHYLVNSASQLQLNTNAAGKSWLYTALSASATDEMEWEFFIKQSFAASGANFGRFYLTSDATDLTGPLNGYYLQFGEAGSNDAVELFRQTGNSSMSLCRATSGAIAASFEIRIKVTRNKAGQWQLYTDYSGGHNFMSQASATDDTHVPSLYCGMLCTYTISNATRFYFDDIVVRSIAAADTSPPEIIAVEVVSSHAVRLLFSEALDSRSAEDTFNYSLSSGVHPASAVMMDDEKTIQLEFSDPFKNGYDEIISTQGVKDKAGNPIAGTQVKFLYFLPHPVNFKDVIITELLADPTPAVGLPEAEFVEILNRGDHAIDLNGWILSDGTTRTALGNYILLPQQYLILTASGVAEKFKLFGDVLSCSPFPSLNNAGDHMSLQDAEGQTIDSLAYQFSWYGDEEKADGGWSLELIDPANICGKDNWVAAEDDSGGTPGKMNSVFANMPDNTGPKLISAIPQDSTALLLVFDEMLERKTPGVNQIRIDPPLPIHAVSFSGPDLTSLAIFLSKPIEGSKAYTISVEDVYDCPGNRIQHGFAALHFVLPEKALPGDIIVNEVLFNPRPTGVDFVEVYNRSEKTVDLKNWSVRNNESAAGNTSFIISEGSLLMSPNEYRVFTEDPNILKGEYVLGNEGTFLKTGLPSFNDDDGSVVITDPEGIVIDSMTYSDRMHMAFIKDDEGISLERISWDTVFAELPNWRSASANAGFATPGYVNSNVRNGILVDDGSVMIEPEIIQPHVIAQDFTRITYRFDQGGLVANVKIFDPQGRSVKEIAENQLLGPEGFFRWDGDLDNGSRARTGYYIVWFEVFDASGLLKTFRKRVAVY